MRPALLLALLLLASCAPTTHGAWNEYHAAWIAETHPTAQHLDVTLAVRVRGWGSQDEMRREAVGRGWKPSPGLAGLCVSGEVPEIWTLIREDGEGRVVLPGHVLGHEAIHAVRLREGRVRNPDDAGK